MDKTALSFASTVREKGGLCLSPVKACTFFRNRIHYSFYCNDFCDNVQFKDMAFQSEIDEMIWVLAPINESHNPPLGPVYMVSGGGTTLPPSYPGRDIFPLICLKKYINRLHEVGETTRAAMED